MLVVVIAVKNYLTAKEQMNLAALSADGIELRLDYLSDLDLAAIAELRRDCLVPVIFTLRSQAQGGVYPKDESQRLQDIAALCALNPDYFDLEYDIDRRFLQEISMTYPQIKLIGSSHNFVDTPVDLLQPWQAMQRPQFYAYKLVTYAQTSLDALRMLVFMQTLSSPTKVTGFCMGEAGRCTRILTPVVGSWMTYTCLDATDVVAPGQVILDELLHIYHYRSLDRRSKIYALLGDPVHLSVGHRLHNQAMVYLEENAVYIKLLVPQELLGLTLALCRQLPFAGFSITMPLKEEIVSLLDEVVPAARAIKAINSICVDQGKLLGFNTDGVGAIRALAAHGDIAKQRIVILGAGGAARAVAYEAIQQGAHVMILNRTLSKARRLAEELGCEAYALSALTALKQREYTMIINTLPEAVYADWSIKADMIRPDIVAMDIVYQPLHTAFLRVAAQARCTCVFGYEMYIFQALAQLRRWFKPQEAQLNAIQLMMYEYFTYL